LVESKTMLQYIRQLERMGEDPEEYQQVYGYSLCETEPRMPIYEYPEYSFKTTKLYTNLEV
jgi:lysine 2,3-aminomutase